MTISDINRDPVVHTWSYSLSEAAFGSGVLEAKGNMSVEGKGDDLGVRLRKADGVIRATWDQPPTAAEEMRG